MFQIKNISKKYTTEYAIKNLNLEIGTGLNFIIGSSGSGKTTLLKIISGMDNNYEGDVFYLGKSIKKLTDNERAQYYNNKFGFIYQDFNLIENMTVEENILLPLHIKNVNTKNEVIKILKRLGISNLKNKKVNLLSGGQKQRVAIARELVKNPDVIIADEPTSALDAKTSKEVIQILKAISKERTVTIVTHDTSLIDENSKVYELDKGELISKPAQIENKIIDNKVNSKSKFDFGKALKASKVNLKSKISRTMISCLSVLVSSILLMTSFSGVISNSSGDTFDKLVKDYGNTILDISVINSFMSASGTGGEDDGPKADVNQDIKGLYEKYINDDRVEYILFMGPNFDNISVEFEGKNYTINSSGNAPTVNKILAGDVPRNKGEVLVPQSFVKLMGISNEEAIGKEIDFNAGVYVFDEEKQKSEGYNYIPDTKDINVKLKIVGVADTNIKSVYEGQSYEFQLEDSFIFDQYTLDEMNKQSGKNGGKHNFVIRAKDMQSLVDIKDELNAKGIVPIGQFELVGDLNGLNSQTANLSKTSTIIISILAIIAVIAISLLTSFMRKGEFAIYKVCGYSKSQLNLVSLAENLNIGIMSAILLVLTSPVSNILMKSLFGLNIITPKTLVIGVVSTFILSMVSYIVSSSIAKKANPIIVLKSGGR